MPGPVEAYCQEAQNAKGAGFDGVEIHGANGYLLDQCLRDSSNRCDDAYGGSVENPARLMLDVTDAVASVWGPGRVGMHLAPRVDAHDMGDSDLAATFGYVLRELAKRRIAFICVRESAKVPRLGPARRLRRRSKRASRRVAFGKLFIANPDLPHRFALGTPLNALNAEAFHSEGPVGYTDYRALEEQAAAAE